MNELIMQTLYGSKEAVKFTLNFYYLDICKYLHFRVHDF